MRRVTSVLLIPLQQLPDGGAGPVHGAGCGRAGQAGRAGPAGRPRHPAAQEQ